MQTRLQKMKKIGETSYKIFNCLQTPNSIFCHSANGP